MKIDIPSCVRPQVAHVAIKYYAAYSYLYYEKDASLISDGEFDELCKWLLKNYEWVKPFDLNDYLSESSLEAGTGFDIASRVCGQTRDLALMLLDKREAPPRAPKAKKKKEPKYASDIEDLF